MNYEQFIVSAGRDNYNVKAFLKGNTVNYEVWKDEDLLFTLKPEIGKTDDTVWGVRRGKIFNEPDLIKEIQEAIEHYYS